MGNTIFNQSGQTVGVQVNGRLPVSGDDLVQQSVGDTLKAALAFAQLYYDGEPIDSTRMTAAVRKIAKTVSVWPSELLDKYQGE